MQGSKSLKTILVLLSLAVLAMFVVYYFAYQDIKSKNENISNLTSDLLQESNKQDYLISTQKAMQSISPDLALVNNSIISKDGDVDFIGNLESIARGDGLTIEISSLVFDNNPVVPSDLTGILKIDAKVNGSWLATYTFLSQMESSPFKIKIDRFNFVNTTDPTLSESKRAALSGSAWQSDFEIDVLKYK